MGTTLKDLNDLLFKQLNKVLDATTDEEIEKESKKAHVAVQVGKSIIDNAQLVLNAQKYATDFGIAADKPDMLMIESNNFKRK